MAGHAVIYGATGTGKNLYKKIVDDYEIVCFIDRNEGLQNTKVFGVEVKNIDSVDFSDIDFVFIGVLTGWEDAVELFSSKGISKENIITTYVDLPSRARRECIEKIETVFRFKNIVGSVAELGVYRGDFAKIINEVFMDRKLYLFDTFEGFPEADINYEKKYGLLMDKVGNLSDTFVEYVLSKMPYKDNCIVCKGYFPDTAEGIEEKFCFVNIDTDLYSSILAGLEWFWPRMITGGYIFVHDYFSFSYAGAKKAVDEFSEKHKVGFIPIGDAFSVAFIKY